MRKFLPVLLSVFLLVVVSPLISSAFAQNCPANQTWTDFGCVPNDPVGFTVSMYGILLGILGMLSVLFMIVGGYNILTSQGNPMKIQKGKEFITYSIIGLLLGVFGFAFVQFITAGLLRIPGFS